MTDMRTDPNPATDEAALRDRLGIPAHAERVLVLAESTHWDPDWLLRSDQYFRWMVKRNLDKTVTELRREPRRVFGLECTFFPQMYWDAVGAEQRDRVRDLANRGRLRFTGSGVTTPDTLVPREETLLRDWLLGQEWLRSKGIVQEPRLTYLPDSFGHSPELPDLLQAAGFDMAAVTRIDGMYFPGTDWEPRRRFPRPGSTAQRLLEEERTLDFVWKSSSGAEVLAHWNAFGYGQGDMIAGHGPVRLLTFPSYVPDRRESFLRRRVESYVRDLAPVARTPYMLLTLGLDFVPPVPRLWDSIDGWNERDFERTGVWLTNAAFEDYLALVGTRRHLLPEIAFDPNPYWTGFYSARPDLKRACLELADTLVLAESACLADGDAARAGDMRDGLADAWHIAVTANHHDWITGTSPDRVVATEQRPWLESAQAAASRALAAVPAAPQPEETGEPPHVTWRREGTCLVVDTPGLHAVIDDSVGGCVVALEDRDTGAALVAAPAADVVVFEDSGGLWRMGMEYVGGRYREVDAASRRSARTRVEETVTGIDVVVTCEVAGRVTERRYVFGGAPRLHVRTRLGCDDRRTAVLRLPTTTRPSSLDMHQPGGVVSRPLQRGFDPTYWPLHSFVAARNADKRGVGVATDMPTAVAVSPHGVIDVVVARNAVKEQAWGVVPLLANPAKGRVRQDVDFDIALWAVPATAGPHHFETVWRDLVDAADPDPARRHARALVAATFTTDDPHVSVVAAKLAHRDGGMIVRLRDLRGGATRTRLRVRGVDLVAASRCDARERDLESLVVAGDGVDVPLAYGFATVRLVT
ncbi:MAG: hypothetical protein IT198_08730 [Acidimicrobiia bacterium]|nr:hypothetical protein [Acidimicrobiia bacterium]